MSPGWGDIGAERKKEYTAGGGGSSLLEVRRARRGRLIKGFEERRENGCLCYRSITQQKEGGGKMNYPLSQGYIGGTLQKRREHASMGKVKSADIKKAGDLNWRGGMGGRGEYPIKATGSRVEAANSYRIHRPPERRGMTLPSLGNRHLKGKGGETFRGQEKIGTAKALWLLGKGKIGPGQ